MGMPTLLATVTEWAYSGSGHNWLKLLTPLNTSHVESATLHYGGTTNPLALTCSGDTWDGSFQQPYDSTPPGSYIPCSWAGGVRDDDCDPQSGSELADWEPGDPCCTEGGCDVGVTVDCDFGAPYGWQPYAEMCFNEWWCAVVPNATFSASTGVLTVVGVTVVCGFAFSRCPSDQNGCPSDVPSGMGQEGGLYIEFDTPKTYGPYGDPAAVALAYRQACVGAYEVPLAGGWTVSVIVS